MAAELDIKSAIRAVVEGGTLDSELAAAAMDQIMTGAVTPAQIGALVTALRMRGETVEEIAGFASAMRGTRCGSTSIPPAASLSTPVAREVTPPAPSISPPRRLSSLPARGCASPSMGTAR